MPRVAAVVIDTDIGSSVIGGPNEAEENRMKVIIKKWGKSAAVRLPAAVMKSANLFINQEVELEMRDGFVTLRPVGRRRRSLDELIAETPNFERLSGWLEGNIGNENETF